MGYALMFLAGLAIGFVGAQVWAWAIELLDIDREEN